MTVPNKIKSLEDAKVYHRAHSSKWIQILDCLERTLTDVRDRGKVPIYLTKGRIKQPESAYLKFKRKGRTDPSLITDWIGFRVLCLFQQDVNEAFDFLLDLLLNQKAPSAGTNPSVKYFGLKEITIFNWPIERADILIQQLQKKLGPMASKTEIPVGDGLDIAYTYTDDMNSHHVISFEMRRIKKGTGYQSVHFVAEAHVNEREFVSCEIQLRTLLQDVWGELEHALSYKKGKIHPHISNSFQLLSRELEAKDILVSQLRDIRDQERALVRYSSTSAGPSRWLNYPAGFLEELPEPAHSKFGEYIAICQARRRGMDNAAEWPSQAKSLFDEAVRLLDNQETEVSKYVITMEQAYLDYCSGKIFEAEEQYRKVIVTLLGSSQWFPYFRLGETCLAQEDKIGEALFAFDQCEEKMSEATENVVDRYFAKIGLAYGYWSLSKEFLDTAVRKMEEARDLIEPHLRVLAAAAARSDEEIVLRLSLANNLCFYYLEHWLATPEKAVVGDIHKRKQHVDEQYDVLRELATSYHDALSSNVCDTLAWYCYQVSERAATDGLKKEWISRARSYIQQGEYLSNRAPSRMISNSIQREHSQVILSKFMSIESRQ